MRRRLTSLAFIALWAPSGVWAKDICTPELSPALTHVRTTLDLYGRTFPVTAVNGARARLPLERVIPDLGPDDLVIGVQAGHAYLMYKKMRYDGEVPSPLSLIFGNAKIRATDVQPAEGVLIRLRGLPPAALERLDAVFATEHRVRCLTCATGVRGVVGRAGVTGLGILPPVTGNLLLRQLLTADALVIDGIPIGRDIFLYNTSDLRRQALVDRIFTLSYVAPSAIVTTILVLNWLY